MLEHYGIVKGIKIQASEDVDNYFYLSKGVPLNTFGKNGDYSLNTDTNHLYLKASGTWSFAGISKKFPDNNSVSFTTIPDGFDFSFTYNHNLNYFPKITILDSNDEVNICVIKYINSNTIKIFTNQAFTGRILF